MSFAAAMLIALLIDVAVGWPDALARRIGHPVSWLGGVIAWLEAHLNRGSVARRYAMGCVLVVVAVLLVGGGAWAVAKAIPNSWVGVLVVGILAWPLVAARSLHRQVAAIAVPLADGDLAKARRALSVLADRDPEALHEPATARAALERLAERASDGVVAPLFWGALLGLPGIAVYNAISTMDVKARQDDEHGVAFGYPAARLSDLANLIPARLTGALIAAAAIGVRGTAFRTMLRDARGHRLSNARWPKAAMAGGLGVRLSGGRGFDGGATEDQWLNPVAGDPRPRDLQRGLIFYQRAMALFGVLLLVAVVT